MVNPNSIENLCNALHLDLLVNASQHRHLQEETSNYIKMNVVKMMAKSGKFSGYAVRD